MLKGQPSTSLGEMSIPSSLLRKISLNLSFVGLFISPKVYHPLFVAILIFAGVQRVAGTKRRLEFIALIPLSLLGILSISNEIELKEVMRIFEIALFLAFIGVFHFRERISTFSFGIIFGTIVLFSIGDVFQITSIQQYKEMIWPLESEMSWDYGSGATSGFRLASIYYNPNILGQALVFLVPFAILSCRSVASNVIVIVVGVLIILTGSRTALVAYSAQLFLFLVSSKVGHEKYRTVKNVAVFVTLSVTAVGIINSIGMSLDNLRALSLISLVTKGGSGVGKLEVTAEYFNEIFASDSLIDFWRVLLGNGALNLAEYTLDNEIAYGIFAFGIIGTFAIALRISEVCALAMKMKVGHINVVWLFSIGATNIFSYRFIVVMFLLYAIALSPTINKSEQAKTRF